MKTNKSLCKSHITILRKVSTRLAYKQTMQFSQLILGDENLTNIELAEKHICDAINLLEKIK